MFNAEMPGKSRWTANGPSEIYFDILATSNFVHMVGLPAGI